MIKSNLNELMGKYRLTITKVSEDTKINRNTISGLYKDTLKRVDYDTIDRLCVYFREQHGFECNVSNLLEYVPDTAE